MLYQGISVSEGMGRARNRWKADKSLVERVSGMIGFEKTGKFL